MIGPQLPPNWQQRQHAQPEQEQEQEQEVQPDPHVAVPVVAVTELSSVCKTPMGAGLLNLGNSCFMNSVLQCLAYVPPLTQAVSQRKLHGFHQTLCPLRHRGVWCAACLIEQQLASQPGSQRAGRPDAVHSNLQLFSKAFIRGRQEDAHEFLLAVLDAVERDSRRGLVAMRHPKTARTLVESLFCGRLVSKVTCLECGHVSCSYELLTSLSLDVGARVSSVVDSLDQFSAHELLDGANKYKCDKCNRLVRARKSLHVHEEPNVLVIHLKRFNSLMPMTAKINRHISFGLSLRLQPHHHPHPHGVQHKQPPGYTLTGVVVHQGGSVHSGHYFAYVRDSMGNWYCANDSSVHKVRTEQVFQQQAYLLFYSRNAFKPLGPHPVPAAAAPAAPPSSPSAAATSIPSPGKSTVTNGHTYAEPGPSRLHVLGPELPPAHGQPGKLQGPKTPAPPPAISAAGNGRAPRIIQLGAARTHVTLQPKIGPVPGHKQTPVAAPSSAAHHAETQHASALSAGQINSAADASTLHHTGHSLHDNGHVAGSSAKHADGAGRHENGHATHINSANGSEKHVHHQQHDVHGSRQEHKLEQRHSVAHDSVLGKQGGSMLGKQGVSVLGKHPRSLEVEPALEQQGKAAPPASAQQVAEVQSAYADQCPGPIGDACRDVKRQALDFFRSNPEVMNGLRAAITAAMHQGLTQQQAWQQEELQSQMKQLLSSQGAAKFKPWAAQLQAAQLQKQP